jgi:hypothetical protein
MLTKRHRSIKGLNKYKKKTRRLNKKNVQCFELY